jgi:hypothetical protein
MPRGAVYVGRPTKWGNQFYEGHSAVRAVAEVCRSEVTPELVLLVFRNWVMAPEQHRLREEARRELRGKPLVCWCALERPCHADTWLEIANG